MQHVLEYLAKRTAAFEVLPLHHFLRDDSIPPEERLMLAPCAAYFVMSFADLYALVLREEPARDRYQEIVNAHTYEDGGHWKWFLSDLEKLGHDPTIKYTDALRFLWGEKTLKSRQLFHTVCHLGMRASSLQRLILVQCVEATGKISLVSIAHAGRALADKTHQKLVYFGPHHLATESEHTLEEDGVKDLLGEVVLSEQDRSGLFSIIDDVFMCFTELSDEMLKFALSHHGGFGLPERKHAENAAELPRGARMNQTSHEHKVQEFYDSARHCYEQIMGEYWHHADPEAAAVGLSRQRACELFEERIISLCGLKPGGKAIDFGSGIGGPTRHMARYASASFVGVCNNDRLTQEARERTTKLALSEQVSFLTLDDTGYKNLPFDTASFDAATFFESVCHVPDKAALFRELARVLKPGCCLGGMDWIQRPFGEHQTEEQIMKFIQPVNDVVAMPWLGTVGDYKRLMEEAGLHVFIAKDMVPDTKCWGVVQDDENPQWLGYDGPDATMFRQGEEALVAARNAGVFSIGMWIAGKPRQTRAS